MTGSALALALLLQAAQATPPVLAFPEPGVDDPRAYQGYQTRFFRDSKRNAVQVYLQPQTGRTVLVWADAANESAGFTARDPSGKPVAVTWDGDSAVVSDSGAARSIEFRLTAPGRRVDLGWFVLGSMRIERDFVYAERHLQPFSGPPYRVAEESLLVAGLSRLPADERRSHLALLRASSVAELRQRLLPTIAAARADTGWVVRIERPSLDGRNLLRLELRTGPEDTVVTTSDVVSLRSRRGGVSFRVRVTTDAGALTPLDRDEIFNREFHRFLAEASRAGDSAGRLRYRRLERQVKAVELLSAREKLMAGLPNFATYFGRDMMMTALMMRPAWEPTMSEHVIASVLRKLGPGGEVSHEEALGGQAIREHALVYDSLLAAWARAARGGRRAESAPILTRARDLLRDLQRTRENYHMIDDEYQLPVLVARYLSDSAVPDERKRTFLLETEGATTRLAGLLRELALVAAQSRAYARDPRPLNLVSFPRRDSVHWRSASWRDSDAGYAGGRFAMDVNAIWVPEALRATSAILGSLSRLGFGATALDSMLRGPGTATLRAYARDTLSLRRAVETWQGARRHFEVRMSAAEAAGRVRAKLAWLPVDEQHYWERVLRGSGERRDSLAFLAISLDHTGKPIPVVNTDPATGLFLGSPVVGLPDLQPFVRPYPVGLFADSLGPLVANDAYASQAIWERFRKDTYHGPRVVWGREVNLLLLGLVHQAAGGTDGAGRAAEALRRTLEAVHASGLEHSELWSYRIEDGGLLPTRYGTTSDIQLWSATSLAVQFALARLDD